MGEMNQKHYVHASVKLKPFYIKSRFNICPQVTHFSDDTSPLCKKYHEKCHDMASSSTITNFI